MECLDLVEPSAARAEEIGYCTKAVPADILESEVHHLAGAIAVLPRDVVVMGRVARRHMYDRMGLTTLKEVITYHTLSVNLKYTQDEKDLMFIKDREGMGEREAFHKLHEKYDEALEKTQFFKTTTHPNNSNHLVRYGSGVNAPLFFRVVFFPAELYNEDRLEIRLYYEDEAK
jgi:hypothetical protein